MGSAGANAYLAHRENTFNPEKYTGPCIFKTPQDTWAILYKNGNTPTITLIFMLATHAADWLAIPIRPVLQHASGHRHIAIRLFAGNPYAASSWLNIKTEQHCLSLQGNQPWLLSSSLFENDNPVYHADCLSDHNQASA